jgi:hypothetical protein
VTVISTGWADVEASILADWAAGFTVRQIAARCGWGRQTDLDGVLAATVPRELEEVAA